MLWGEILKRGEKMIEFYKKHGRTLIDWMLITVTGLALLFLFYKFYQYGLAILLSLIIFGMIEPFAKFLHSKLEKKRIKKGVSTFISMLLFLGILFGGITLIGSIVTPQINDFAKTIPKYVDMYQGIVVEKTDELQEKFEALPPEVTEKSKEYATNFLEKIGSMTSGLVIGTINALSASITLAANFLIGLVLAFFLSTEVDQIRNFTNKKLPRTLKNGLHFIKNNVVKGIAKFIVAQLKIIGCTFVIILVGLSIFQVENAFTIALISAVLDLLPIVGVATVFIPWFIYLFATGNIVNGFIILGIWVVVLVFRQIAEPKIMSDSFGISAFVMLAGMALTVNIFGVAGIFLSPIFIILIKAIYDEGLFRKWVKYPKGEYDELGK